MKRFIVLFSAVILCLTLAGCSGSQYKKATELYEQGNYAEAGEIFSKLGNYEDSADKANECKYQEASALLQNSDYDAAKALFSALGDYGDSADKVKFCDYKKAEKLLADDDYDAAKAIFSALGSYENSADQVKECDYEKAEELFNQEKYEEALKIYETISEYKTSKERIITINSKFLYETYGDIIDLLDKSTRHFPACSHNFPKAGEARFQGLSRLFRLLGKFPYLGESRRILMAVSSKTSSKTRFCYAATRRISSAAVQPSIWA